MEESIANRIKFLEKEIAENNELYWSGNPKISDFEYDKLIEELKQIDPNNPLINEVLDVELNDSNKVYHKIPMLSLDKVYSLNDLIEWIKSVARNENEMFLIQPKYDGISGKLENFKYGMEQAVLSTRGNGEVGQNISNKIPIINFETNWKSKDYILGEIVIRKDDFKNLFSKIVSPSTNKCYKNPRNATAGIMGTDDITFFKKQGAKLTFVDYNTNSYELSYKDFLHNWETIEEKILELEYPMDGIVIKLKDNEYGKSLGSTAHHPKNAIAFKFSNPQKETILENVIWSSGKTYLTPVAILKPVEINGVTITKASLANYSNLKKLGCILGDTVTVERSGDVIPTIVKVNKTQTDRDNPSYNPFFKQCPCCHSDLIVEEPEIYCSNPNCPDKILKRLLFSIRAIDIDGIGLPTLSKIMESTNIKNLYEFMNVTRLDLSRAGLGEKTIENIMNAINKHSNIKDYQFLTCLNIQDVGDEVAKLILEKYSIEELLTLNNIEDLVNIKGIGNVTATKIMDYIKNNFKYISMLRTVFNVEKSTSDESYDKTVCFTGEMEHPRHYYEEMALNKGIKPVNTVSKNLTYLVVADINSTSSKTVKAKKYGVNIITVDDFINL